LEKILCLALLSVFSYPQWAFALAFVGYVILKTSGNEARIWLAILAYDKEP